MSVDHTGTPRSNQDRATVAPPATTFSARVTHSNHLTSLVDLAHSRSECRHTRLGRLRKAIDLTRWLACPAALLAFTATALGQSSVTLAWDPVTNSTVAGYRLFQGQGSRTYTSTTNAGTQTQVTASGLASGKTYYFSVTAYTSSGVESDFSTEVAYTVPSSVTNGPSGSPPVISLTSPRSGAAYGAPATISLAANVIANGHTINKVQFYNGSTLLGESLSAPYSFNWANVPAGAYSLSGIAIYDGSSNAASAAVSVTVTNAGSYNMPAGLVAAYGFDEGSGTTTVDQSGTGNNGSLSGALWNSNGRFGKALWFNGSSAAVVINDAPSLDLTTGMTLEAWVNPSALGDWHEVLYKGDELYYLEASSPLTAGAGVGLGSSRIYPMLSSVTPLVLNTWSHLAATYDGSTLRLFINGVQVASRPQTGPISTSSLPLTIGADTLHGSYFAGLIDEVRVYNRPLSASELQTDMNTPVSALRSSPSPSIALIDPADGASYTAPAAMILSASVVINGHTINKVQFYNGGTLLGESTIAPFWYRWGSVPAGTYNLSARLVFDGSAAVASATNRVTVLNPPVVTLTSPADGDSFTAPATVVLGANVTANGHSITKVQFYSGSTLLGESAAAPYSFTVSGLAAGSYAISAQAIYDSGSLAQSASANITVTNPPPLIALVSPVDGSTNIVPGPVTLAATVTPNGHSISAVQFYQGTNLLGEADSAPYSISWTNVDAGNYTVTARLMYDGSATLDATPANLIVVGLPLPWQGVDIGNITNGIAWAVDGNFTVSGAGALGSISDGLRFVYQVLSGDGQITAQITGFDSTNSAAIAGIMVRETLADDAAYAYTGVNGDGNLYRARRTGTGGPESYVTGSPASLPNLWLRIGRTGDTITRSHSADGQNWLVDDSRKIRMATSIYFGLVVNSGSPTDLSTATLTNVDAIP